MNHYYINKFKVQVCFRLHMHAPLLSSSSSIWTVVYYVETVNAGVCMLLVLQLEDSVEADVWCFLVRLNVPFEEGTMAELVRGLREHVWSVMALCDVAHD